MIDGIPMKPPRANFADLWTARQSIARATKWLLQRTQERAGKGTEEVEEMAMSRTIKDCEVRMKDVGRIAKRRGQVRVVFGVPREQSQDAARRLIAGGLAEMIAVHIGRAFRESRQSEACTRN